MRVQNGPKTSLSQQIISSATSYNLSQIQSRLSCLCSPALAPSCSSGGLLFPYPGLEWQQCIMPFGEGGSSRKLPLLDLPYCGRDMGTGGVHTCAGQRNAKHGSSSETVVFTAHTSSMVLCPGHTLSAPCAFPEGPLCPVLG